MSAHSYLQTKACRTVKEANEFLKDLPIGDFFSMQPFTIGADGIILVVYRVNLTGKTQEEEK